MGPVVLGEWGILVGKSSMTVNYLYEHTSVQCKQAVGFIGWYTDSSLGVCLPVAARNSLRRLDHVDMR